jgi:hypothetical protein
LVFLLGGIPGGSLSDCFACINESGYYGDVLLAAREPYVAICANCIGCVLAGIHYILGSCAEDWATSIPCGPECYGAVCFDPLARREYGVAWRIASVARAWHWSIRMIAIRMNNYLLLSAFLLSAGAEQRTQMLVRTLDVEVGETYVQFWPADGFLYIKEYHVNTLKSDAPESRII